MRIKRILVATDFSENAQVAFENAYKVAKQLGAKLYLLHVQDESTLRTAVKEGLLSRESSDEELQAQVEQLTEMRFSKMLAGLSLSEVTIKHLSRRGDPSTAIVDYANEIEADIVVVGMRGIMARSAVVSAVLGSVAEYVMRRSPCPTLIVRLEHKFR